jgi:hypothetical protein
MVGQVAHQVLQQHSPETELRNAGKRGRVASSCMPKSIPCGFASARTNRLEVFWKSVCLCPHCSSSTTERTSALHLQPAEFDRQLQLWVSLVK